jgi:hypothetical protein
MNDELLKKVLATFEEEKLSSFLSDLNEEEVEHISKLFPEDKEPEVEPKKESSEQTGEEDDAEKIASDLKAAGKFFGIGFVEALQNSEKPE